MVWSVSVQAEHFDIESEMRALLGEQNGDNACPGAIATFTGSVRGDKRQDGVNVTSLWIEYYPAMTQPTIEKYCELACQRWELQKIRVVHRVGELTLGENIVFIGVASAHRKDALNACDYVMDQLKTRAPFWKKAYLSNGESQWINVNDADLTSADAW